MSVAVLFVLSLSGLGDFDRVAAASGASPRPVECRVGSTQWSEPQRQAVRAYCRAMGRGYALLSTSPGSSLERAAEALQLRPDSAPALVLHARSLVRLGKHDVAIAEFARAAASSATSMAAAHLDHARALSAMSKWKEAEVAYQRALPVLGLLSGGEGPAPVLEAVAATLLAGTDRYLERSEGLLWPLLRATTSVTGRLTVARLLGLVLTLRGNERQGRELVVGAPGGAAEASSLLPGPVAEMIVAWLTEADAAAGRALWLKIAQGGGHGATLARRRLAQLGGT